MKLLRLIAPLGALILLPHVVHAQRFGFSLGAPVVGAAAQATIGPSASASSIASAPPALPPLPQHLPAAPTSAVPSTTLQPLNLESMHMAPPLNFPVLNRPRATLPAVPFALDPILGAPQMCVDPQLLRH